MAALGIINRIVVAVLSFVAMVAAVMYGSNYTSRFYLAEIAERGHSTLRLSVAGLEAAVSRFEYLPGLVAKDLALKQFLARPEDPGLAGQVNGVMQRVAQETGAAAIFLMNAEGAVVAASNLGGDGSLANRNFSHKPFFQRASNGAIGQYFALGSSSGDRGYYFATPVTAGDRVIGVVAVKVDIENIETAWTSPAHEIIVTDDKTIVFMSSRSDWRYKSLLPISIATRAAIERTGQYAGKTILPLDLTYGEGVGTGTDLMAIAGPDGRFEFLSQKSVMRHTGWTVYVLSKTGPARTQAAIFTIIAALLILILVMFLVVLWQRRAALIERIALQREAQDMLERRVEERTATLNQVNNRLLLEVAEREAAEQELRKTQADLIQAGKLAALGQMSTALSHEFNQPLAAIRSYADNAAILLERDRVAEARENVERISTLTDRMASISKHLRNFARKPGSKMGAVFLKDIVSDTLDLLQGKIASAGADLEVEYPEGDLSVRADHVRLQQVLVNLTANAIDAIGETPAPRFEIRCQRAPQEGWVQITVRDNGPGVDEDALAHVFDPFFTTKDVGQGLGLGLSISFNIIRDFGGMLRVANHADGGAVFTVTLQEFPQASGQDSVDNEDRAGGTAEGIAAE